METDQSIVHLVLNASFIVQLVMLLLLAASLASWALIFKKTSHLKRLEKSANDFEDDFWSVGDMNRLHQDWGGSDGSVEGMASIFVAGYREYTRLAKKGDVARSEMLEGVQRAMRVVLNREIDEIEMHLPFLATVGSTAPYVGLFGTVWGIMNSFRSLGAMKQVTIATVAPGISEALVATAMGLFAAIPAVIAYNRYADKVVRIEYRYDVFTEEFSSILQRHARNKQEA
jgi:biopolymer transport protein TolQ